MTSGSALFKPQHSDCFSREPPDVGLAPTALPPMPPLQLEDPSLEPRPFPSHPPPHPPTPLTLFAMLTKGAAKAGVGEGPGGVEGRALQAPLGARPTVVDKGSVCKGGIALH